MYPRPREKDSGEPKWLGKIEALITQQTSSMSTLTEQLTHYFEDIKGDSRDDASEPPPSKRPKPSAVPLQKSSPLVSPTVMMSLINDTVISMDQFQMKMKGKFRTRIHLTYWQIVLGSLRMKITI